MVVYCTLKYNNAKQIVLFLVQSLKCQTANVVSGTFLYMSDILCCFWYILKRQCCLWHYSWWHWLIVLCLVLWHMSEILFCLRSFLIYIRHPVLFLVFCYLSGILWCLSCSAVYLSESLLFLVSSNVCQGWFVISGLLRTHFGNLFCFWYSCSLIYVIYVGHTVLCLVFSGNVGKTVFCLVFSGICWA